MQMLKRLQQRTLVVIGCFLLCLTLLGLRLRQPQKASLFRLVEIEGVEPPKPFSSSTYQSHPWTTDSQLTIAFKHRLRQRQYPFCDNNFDRFSKLLRPSVLKRNLNKEPISIAITLHNSASIIPALGVALIEAIQYLLPWYTVFLSVYENGSTDNTKLLLAELTVAFDHLSIDGLFIRCTHKKSKIGEHDRIMMLSEVRNLALSPLLPHAHDGTIIFINDILTCASDILELLYQRKLQQADAVVGLDWADHEAYPSPYPMAEIKTGNITGRLNSSNPVEFQPRLYDLWVTRGINGELPYIFEADDGFVPLTPSQDWIADLWSTQSNNIRARWFNALPFPVYSGWGGMAAFDASLFTKSGLRFRSSISSGWNSTLVETMGTWKGLVDDDNYLLQDCPGASECKYLCRDIWNLRNGRARIAAAPLARAAYDIEDWNNLVTFLPPERGWFRDVNDTQTSVTSQYVASPSISLTERIDWDSVTIPRRVVCIPGRNRTGHAVAIWTEDRYYLDPRP